MMPGCPACGLVSTATHGYRDRMVAGTGSGRDAADAYIDGLTEPRRSQMQHLHEVILDALPDIDVGLWDYGGSPVIGVGSIEVGLGGLFNFLRITALSIVLLGLGAMVSWTTNVAEIAPAVGIGGGVGGHRVGSSAGALAPVRSRPPGSDEGRARTDRRDSGTEQGRVRAGEQEPRLAAPRRGFAKVRINQWRLRS